MKDQYDRPWLYCAFNEILDNSKKLGGKERPASQMRGFQDAFDYCQLCSIDAVGPLYTWSNLREGLALVQERLDRLASNLEWLELYPSCRVCNLITSVSDHSCLVLSTNGLVHNVSRKPRLFKFESMWVEKGVVRKLLQMHGL